MTTETIFQDDLQTELTPAELSIKLLSENGEQFKWSEPKLFRNDLLPVKPITPEMLPYELSGWLVDVTERMDSVPFDYAAVSAVIAASVLIGRKATVLPKQYDDWSVTPNLWGACIGKPGMKKSPVIKSSIESLSLLEKQYRNQHKEELEEYKADMKLTALLDKKAGKDAEQLLKNNKHDEARALLLDTSGDPERPVAKRLIVNNATVEKLGVILEGNPAGVLLFRDELSGWISTLNREDRQEERAFYLEAYNGNGSFSYDRIGRDDVYMESTTVSVLGGIQPGKLLPLLQAQKNGVGDDGLIDRLQLMVYPDEQPFQHTDRKPNAGAKEAMRAAFKQLADIPYHPEKSDRPKLRFSPAAQQAFDSWYCRLNKRIRVGDMTNAIESHLSKYSSLMPSLALIFHVVKHGVQGDIDLESVDLAICWCDVLETHAQRVYAMAGDPLAGAKSLAEKLGELSPSFKRRDIDKKGWSGLKGGEIDRALMILEHHCYIARHEESTGGRPAITYYVNPAAIPILDSEE